VSLSAISFVAGDREDDDGDYMIIIYGPFFLKKYWISIGLVLLPAQDHVLFFPSFLLLDGHQNFCF
jgi:hypothetical protein